MTNTYNEKENIIRKFEFLSMKYHKLSLLFYELQKSLSLESKNMSNKEFKVYLKSLNLDPEKIKKLSLGLSDLTLNDLQKDSKTNGI